MLIDQLPSLAVLQETDEFPVERGTTTYKAQLSAVKDLLGIEDIEQDVSGIHGEIETVGEDISSIQESVSELQTFEALHVSIAALSSLPYTVSNANIKADMRVIDCVFGTPDAIASNVTWTTLDGGLQLSGTMSGTTTVDLVLIKTN